MSKFIKKETCHYSYQIIVNTRKSSQLLHYGSYYSALKCYVYLQSRSDFESLVFRYVCERYDNSGNYYIGFGRSKRDSYNDSFRDFRVKSF